MIEFRITTETPRNMLRAIRAACNELLGEQTADAATLNKSEVIRREGMSPSHAAPYTAEEVAKVFNVPVDSLPVSSAERPGALAGDVLETTCLTDTERKYEADGVETDSAGHAWNAELHASTKSKNADGTWKKRRGARDLRDVASDPEGILIHEAGAPLVAAPIAPPVPPTPPAAPAEPIMPKIFALITSQIVTINQAVEAAQAEGFADLGANGLGGAPAEKQLAVLRKLEG